ncbi:MAG: dihydroorotate dehydrogenase electron transfer subunit [Acholeplasmatales bacterium]|nr:dihydroorotate dehydrogenase electron transfer subunit [Acholeplasmatales bacterium]
MKNVVLTIKSNIQVGKDIFLMRLEGDCTEIKNPGEFINIQLPNYYLRRPISVCDYSDSHVDILYKVLGQGTNDMSKYEVGTQLDILIGLGNGFEIKKDIRPVLVGGGIGIAPLIGLAKKYNELGIKPVLIYGARNQDDLVLTDALHKLCELHLCTDDGSMGFKGNVVNCIKDLNLNIDYYYSCGPYRMLEALAKAYPNGCVSLEARMGCGFGACMGCSIKTTNGPKRVCKEGPVFEASEVEF